MVKQNIGVQNAPTGSAGGNSLPAANGQQTPNHDFLVRGVDLGGQEQKPPIILQMNDDDFPTLFLQDLSSAGEPLISSTIAITGSTLFQPVQRIVHLALVKLSCNDLGFPRVDPTRVLSAGLVVRRVFRRSGVNGGAAFEDQNTLSAWVRSPSGQLQWVRLRPDQEDLDPNPLQRPQLWSGQAELDRQIAALTLSAAFAESTTPAFAAPPAICAALNRTVFYAVIPTASSEVSNNQSTLPPEFDRTALISSLPALLRSSQNSNHPGTPLPAPTVDYRWMTDDFLNAVYPPAPAGAPSASNPTPLPLPRPEVSQFQGFTTALRMLHSVFGAFDGSMEGNKILEILDQHKVTFGQSPDSTTQFMGQFYQAAKIALLDYNAYPNSSPTSALTLTMPTAWDSLDDNDQTMLVNALLGALTPRSQNLLGPQGRFQDTSPARHYRLRLFFRLKSKTPGCPPELVWSQYSEPFRIAPWYEGGQRSHPPVPIPDPTSDFVKNAKPNCAFQVPGSLMGAMQGTTLSGLMKGDRGGSGLSLGWICGFNIPLITICAFFVLNIFLGLLNIIFFWLPFIKICIPFPTPSPSSGDEGTT
jgi:hypothetical protein